MIAIEKLNAKKFRIINGYHATLLVIESELTIELRKALSEILKRNDVKKPVIHLIDHTLQKYKS